MIHHRYTLALLFLTGVAGSGFAATRHVPRDQPTIQGAINASASGDLVLVAPGTYRESLRLKAGITVKSAGDDTRGKIGLRRAEETILEGAGAAAKEPLVILAEGATLDGLTITRVGLFDQKEYDKHHTTQGEHLPDARGVVGTENEFPALSVAGVTGIVRHCLVHHNGHPGIGCTGQHNASWIHNNVVSRNMGGGIGLADGAHPLVQANRCFNNLRAGIGNRNAAGLIDNNECFDNVRAGIGIREGAKPIVRRNRCYQNRRAGIGIRMVGTTPILEDNDCSQNAMAGIGCRDGAEPVIRGNRCHGNTLAGIGSRDKARPVIVDNKCYRNKEAGIGSEQGSRAVITHNECYENDKAGIGQRSDADTVISDNQVHHNKGAGIGFEECKAGKALVLHNKVNDNEQVAIGIHAGWTVRLTDNQLSRAGGLPPIVMVYKGARAEFTGNTLRGSGVAGIRTEGVVRVVNNQFDCPSLRKGGPPNFAVWGLPGADLTLTNNTISGWRHALVAEKATVHACSNRVSNYWQTGMRITQPPTPVIVLGNVFESESKHPGVVLSGAQGIVQDNRVEAPRNK